MREKGTAPHTSWLHVEGGLPARVGSIHIAEGHAGTGTQRDMGLDSLGRPAAGGDGALPNDNAVHCIRGTQGALYSSW